MQYSLQIDNFFQDIDVCMYMNYKCTDWQIEKGLHEHIALAEGIYRV